MGARPPRWRPARIVRAHGGGHREDDARETPRSTDGARAGARGARLRRPDVRPPLVPIEAARDDAAKRFGAKAASLALLASAGARVPPAVIVPADVAARIAAGDTLVTELTAGALDRWLERGRTYAVRASVRVDGAGHEASDGRLRCRLDVPADDVLAAIRDLVRWEPAEPAALPGAGGVAPPDGRAVIVQSMVAAEAAGIAFSRNPLTGLDEVMVEAVPGRGDALVDEGVTPDRWIHRWGAFVAEPATPRVPRRIAEAAAREAAAIARADGGALDLEWVHDGSTIWWLRSRPITGIEDLHVYSNRIARDVLPGVILPLVWSVNVPIVNGAWIGLLEELVGPLELAPEDLARSFGYRAYFDMTALGSVFEALGMPRDSLELLLGLPKGPEAPRFRPGRTTVRHVPRVMSAGRRTLARGRWARAEIRGLERARAEIARTEAATLDAEQLLARVDAIATLARRAAYANIVIPLVMLGYARLLERILRDAGVDPTTVDPTAGRRDRAAWTPTRELDTLRATVATLPPGAIADLGRRRAAALDDREDLLGLGIAVGAFLERYGHLSESGNDLSRATWREDPDAVVDLLLAHPERQDPLPTLGLAEVEPRVATAVRPLFRLVWRRTGAFRVYRDAAGATWARCYGLFRPTFLALGERLVAAGLVDRADDVFHLTLDEVRALVRAGTIPGDDPRSAVARRRGEAAAAADLIVPDLVYGDAFVPRRRDEAVRATLAGIPTSRGSVRGIARVVRGADDFARVKPGDVLVIPYSDVAWTPLFARASAVVAEAGGILSHSSVVAREYAIPCIVSVADACSVIPDGATVIVDGTAGTVLVEDALPA